MSKLLYRVDVREVTQADSLVAWCDTTLAKNEWNIQLNSIAPPHYVFTFTNEQNQLMATLLH